MSYLEHESVNKDKRITALIEQRDIVDKKLQDAESKNRKWEGVISDAEKQETTIEQHVKLTEVRLGDVTLTGYDPTVRFGIYVINRSRLNISLAHDLESQIKGTIEFSGYKSISLRGTKTVLYEAKNIAPGQSGCLTIEQRLIDNEAKVIEDGRGWPPANFDLSDLTINIVGAEPTLDVTPVELEMQNATVNAFPLDLLERGKRIRAVAEVRGSAVQLQQVLTVIDEPLPKEVLERWESASKATLGLVYDEAGLIRVWEHLTDKTPIPSTAANQRGWLQTRFILMGAFLAELTGEYINRKTINA